MPAIEVAGGLAVSHGARSPFSAAIGVGLGAPIAEGDVDRIEAHLGPGGGPVRIEVTPFTDPSLTEELGRRGYQLERFFQVWTRASLGRAPRRRGPDRRAVGGRGLGRPLFARLPGRAHPVGVAAGGAFLHGPGGGQRALACLRERHPGGGRALLGRGGRGLPLRGRGAPRVRGGADTRPRWCAPASPGPPRGAATSSPRPPSRAPPPSARWNDVDSGSPIPRRSWSTDRRSRAHEPPVRTGSASSPERALASAWPSPRSCSAAAGTWPAWPGARLPCTTPATATCVSTSPTRPAWRRPSRGPSATRWPSTAGPGSGW